MLLRGSTSSWGKKIPPLLFLSRRKEHLVSNLQSTISPIRLIIFVSTSEAKQTNKTNRRPSRTEQYFNTDFFSNVKSTTSSDSGSEEDFGERWCVCVSVWVLGMICEVLSFMSVPLNSFILSQFGIPIFFCSEASKREFFSKTRPT